MSPVFEPETEALEARIIIPGPNSAESINEAGVR
jgi:hypothetical protein